jgi:hypothetical protein
MSSHVVPRLIVRLFGVCGLSALILVHHSPKRLTRTEVRCSRWCCFLLLYFCGSTTVTILHRSTSPIRLCACPRSCVAFGLLVKSTEQLKHKAHPVDGNSKKHYASRSRAVWKIARIATPAVVVRAFFRFPYYASRSYPERATTPPVVSDAFLFIGGSVSFSLYAPRGKARADISSLPPQSSKECHVKAYKLHLFGRAPFRVSTIKPDSNNARFALSSVSSDFQRFHHFPRCT